MSCGRTSIWAHVSAAHLMGESCVHGIAFGSPTQEENGITKNKCEHETVQQCKHRKKGNGCRIYQLFLKKIVY